MYYNFSANPVTPDIGVPNMAENEAIRRVLDILNHSYNSSGIQTVQVRAEFGGTLPVLASGDTDDLQLNNRGRLRVTTSVRSFKVFQFTTITSSTAETTVLTGDVSNMLDVYGVIATNNSATVTKLTFKDATGGTTRFSLEVPALETRGFMLHCDCAYNQATANANWTATCGTSVNNVDIAMFAFKTILTA